VHIGYLSYYACSYFYFSDGGGTMSTHAIIKIEGFTACNIYKHCDGYPEYLLPWLTRFNENFKENRGVDPKYKFAQLLRDSVRSESEFRLNKSQFTGWGVTMSDTDDYTYTLHSDGRVTFKEAGQ
jgi:hypothetical protein